MGNQVHEAPELTVVGMVTHHKLLLVASHAGAPLGVLVSSDE